MKKADLIIDLQYGSTGKGLIAGYLGATGNYDLVVNANMPNAGHTYIDVHGNKMMHKVLPNGLVGKSVKNVVIAAGSVFSLDVLQKELDILAQFGYDHFNLHIHENAVVLKDGHISAEQEGMLDQIGSTKQGSAAAMIDKIMRISRHNPTAGVVLRETKWRHMLISQAEYLKLLHASKATLIEGAQGYSLGINAGFYPYCTSRDCTPARFMADCGVPLPYLRKVIGTARMHPIRVGGDSGPCYEDQKELDWNADLGIVAERTTVTNRIRRVFTWSQQQIEEAIMACQPDEIFLNFCNYDPSEVNKVLGKIHLAAHKVGCYSEVKYTGWGPNHDDIARHLR